MQKAASPCCEVYKSVKKIIVFSVFVDIINGVF